MEYRKIIGFGKSSFVISLPKDWVSRHALTKGSTITVSEENESIVISPNALDMQKQAGETKTIETKGKSEKLLQREIISAYISGYHTIVITGDDIKERSKPLSSSFKNLIALEIIKHDDTSIIARDFLDVAEIDLKDIIRKIDNNLRSMLIETDEMLSALQERSIPDEERNELLRLIQERDDAINKLAFLSFRAIKGMLMNPSKTRESMINLFQSWTTVLYIERAGDELKRLFRAMLASEFSADDINGYREALAELSSLYKSIMRIYHDPERSAHKEKSYKLAEQCRLFQQKRKELTNGHDEQHVVVNERLMNFAGYLEEILRLTYDFL